MSDERERLAADQAKLVRALVAAGPVPPGFRSERVEATALSLARKRARLVQRARPLLAAARGDAWRDEFVAWALDHPLPPAGGVAADAQAFGRVLMRRRQLGAAAWLEQRRIDASTVASRGRWHPRRGLFIRARIFLRPLRLVAVVRLPRRGVGWLEAPRR